MRRCVPAEPSPLSAGTRRPSLRAPRWAIWALVGATLGGIGCGRDANYTLQLIPVVPLNQSPFANEPEVWITVRGPDGDATWESLGSLSTGSAEKSSFGPLNGDRVGVALASKDSPENAPTTITAYGETGPLTLAKDNEEIDIEVLIAQTDGIGGLSTLERSAYGAAIATLDDGRVYLFGGVPIAGGSCQPTIQRARELNAGEWSFSSLTEELPEGICYAEATVVDIDGRQQIVVSGGESVFGGWDKRSRRVSIFDPDADEVTWSERGDLARTRHLVSELPDGRLMMVSANWVDGGTSPRNASYEVFDPSRPGFDDFGDVAEIMPIDFMSAPTPGGAALCGGARWVGSTMTPLSTCGLLTADGSFDPLPNLPWRLRAGAMGRLADGRLLVVGGISEEAQAGQNAPGGAEAFILDPNADTVEWTQVGNMNAARAFPKVISDASGGAIVVGGAAQASGFGADPIDVADCAERFVPDSEGGGTFETLKTCSEAGNGLLPAVDLHPGFGALLLEGRGSGQGAESFGVVALGPSR